MVEDDAVDARLIIDQLSMLPGDRFTFERVDGLEAALVRLRGGDIDVILLDLGLPDSSGLATFHRVHMEAPDFPIVVITGRDDDEAALKAIEAGAQDYLVKGRIEGATLSRVLHYAVARKRAEAVLAASDAYYRTILENVLDAVLVMDSHGRYLDVNPAACTLTGYSRHELLNRSVTDLCMPDDCAEEIARLHRRGLPGTGAGIRRMVRKDGTVILVEGRPTRLPDNRIVSTNRDVTEREGHAAQVEESERRFRELAETVREAFFVLEPVTGLAQYVNPAYERIFEQDLSYASTVPNAWTDRIHPDDRGSVVAAEREHVGGGDSGASVFRVIRTDGSTRWIRGRVSPVKNAAGTATRLVGIVEDITELKGAEEQFFESQKMEAVGRLAGGVAHDFNNLLTAILGYVELLGASMAPSDPRLEDVTEIGTAAQRAVGLTRQLLAFSRHQVLEFTVLRPNDVILNLEKMLQRLIGEDIMLRVRLSEEEANVRGDIGQLEQVIVNLVVNSRDAMPSGGALTIGTANVTVTERESDKLAAVSPGRYVKIEVSDTGEGMTPEIQARIFEPFFTTKAANRGTGLGLSTVFGIVKQSGGHIRVDSVPKVRTTFTIYLPRVDDPVSAIMAPVKRPESLNGSETVLLVEDDPQLRRLCSGLLRRLGYHVLQAASAEEALAIAAEHAQPIALLVTDVIMSGASGPTLAHGLETLHPETLVLYMSGYTGDAIVHHGLLRPGLNYLQKPFTPTDLAARVRHVLDSS